MALFEMIKYHKQKYPSTITLCTEEVAGHFDVKSITPIIEYSLHTEYSYGNRSFASPCLAGLNALKEANIKGVPQLWKNRKWAEEFAEFIFRVTDGLPSPIVIEIHPPFDDYTNNIRDFVKSYTAFEEMIAEKYPNTDIYLENRCGSVYSGGQFVVSTYQQMIDLCEQMERDKLKLRLALDIPQLYTAHSVATENREIFIKLLKDVCKIRRYIGGVHLWGKKLSNTGRKVAHCGDLNTYFDNDLILKAEFLSALGELFDDAVCRRLVLEVNSSNEDLISIINDLDFAGFKYI